MGKNKWQTVALIFISILLSGGLVTTTGLFDQLFTLRGIDYTYSGDEMCASSCVSYINVTTSYWRVCFEHTKPDQKIYIPNKRKLLKTTLREHPDTVLFKKSTHGRTLWVNLNNVEQIITTNPYVPVDWLVPARGKDNWRPIKDGDCWDRGKVNRIKLVGHKKPQDTVKWGFTAAGVDVDPLWFKPRMCVSITCGEILQTVNEGDKIDSAPVTELYSFSKVISTTVKTKYTSGKYTYVLLEHDVIIDGKEHRINEWVVFNKDTTIVIPQQIRCKREKTSIVCDNNIFINSTKDYTFKPSDAFIKVDSIVPTLSSRNKVIAKEYGKVVTADKIIRRKRGEQEPVETIIPLPRTGSDYKYIINDIVVPVTPIII